MWRIWGARWAINAARCRRSVRKIHISASGRKEPVVLLSPAAASYDQFKNFEVRGDHFRELVRREIASQQAGIEA